MGKGKPKTFFAVNHGEQGCLTPDPQRGTSVVRDFLIDLEA